MKRLLSCAAGCLLALFAVVPVLAQDGPWADAPNLTEGSGSYYMIYSFIELPADNVIWKFSFYNFGMGVQYTQLVRSVDNGATWLEVPAPYRNSLQDLWTLDERHAWLISNVQISSSQDKQVLQQLTADAKSFIVSPTQVPTNVWFVRFFTPDTGVLIGYGDTSTGTWPIYRTTDAGFSWQLQANTPAVATSLPPALCKTLGSHIWVTNTSAQLLHSPDAGLTWTTATIPENFSQLSFRDAQHGLAYGARNASDSPPVAPALYRTADGGTTWAKVIPTGPQHWIGMTAVPGSTGTYMTVGRIGAPTWPVGSGTTITRDDGNTWQELGGQEVMSYITADQHGNAWSATTNYGKLRKYVGSVLATAAPHVAAASIYPNPTTGRVQLPAAGPHRQVTVYDAAGRQCRTALLGPAETALDLSSFGAGLYLLRLDGGTAAPQLQRVAVTP